MQLKKIDNVLNYTLDLKEKKILEDTRGTGVSVRSRSAETEIMPGIVAGSASSSALYFSGNQNVILSILWA